jgi:hypothetical protein
VSPEEPGRILLAVVPTAARRIARALHDQKLLVVGSSGEAVRTLRLERFRLIVLGIYFDESRMFELLPIAQASELNRQTPVLCVRGVAGQLSAAAVKGLARTALALGHEWLDMATIPDDHAGQELLRRQLLRLLERAGSEPR